MLVHNAKSLTHVSVIEYMIDTNGMLACSCDPCNNNGTYSDCPWWDYHIRVLQKHKYDRASVVLPCLASSHRL